MMLVNRRAAVVTLRPPPDQPVAAVTDIAPNQMQHSCVEVHRTIAARPCAARSFTIRLCGVVCAAESALQARYAYDGKGAIAVHAAGPPPSCGTAAYTTGAAWPAHTVTLICRLISAFGCKLARRNVRCKVEKILSAFTTALPLWSSSICGARHNHRRCTPAIPFQTRTQKLLLWI